MMDNSGSSNQALRNENGCLGKQTHLWRQVNSSTVAIDWAGEECFTQPTHWQCVWCGELRPYLDWIGGDAALAQTLAAGDS